MRMQSNGHPRKLSISIWNAFSISGVAASCKGDNARADRMPAWHLENPKDPSTTHHLKIMKINRLIFAIGLLGTAATATTQAQTTYFWDTNGATPGLGTSPRNGIWGVDTYWSTTQAGNVTTTAWPGNVRPATPA